MLFRNTRNGAVIDAPESFGGKFWEPVTTPAPVAVSETNEAPKKAPAKRKAAPKK